MKAVEHTSHGSRPGRSSPRARRHPDVIRNHLLDEGQKRFDQALTEAEHTRDRDVLDACVEHWRIVAISLSSTATP